MRNKRALLLASAVIGLVVHGMAAMAASDCMVRVAEWPIRLSEGNKLLVDGAINGQKVDIALDTGAMSTLILRSEAARLGLKPSWTRGFRMFGVGGETEVEHVLIDEFKIGPATRKNWYMFVAGEQDVGGEFTVLLGDDFFHYLDVEFDLAHNMVRLFQSKGCGNASLAYWATEGISEAAIEPFDPARPRIFVIVQINRRPVRALLDSGAASTLLNKSVATQLGMNPGMPGVVAAGRVRGMGKSFVEAWIAPFESLAIGNEAIKETAIPFAELPAELPMVLGADFLRAHRVLVSHSQRRIYFTYSGGPVFQLASYDAAIRMNPDNADAFLGRARAAYSKKEYDRAIADYDAAVRINPRLVAAFVGRGNAWRAKGDLDRALADYDVAVGIDPQSAPARVDRGNAWYAKKEYDRAIADLGRAVEINPKFAPAYVTLGNAKKLTGDLSGAIADYARAIEVDPKLAAAHNQLAWELATAENPALRDGQRAVESALKACELSRWMNPNYVDTLAAAYARAGNFDDAIKWQRKAMEYLGRASLAGDENATQRLQLYEQSKAWPPD